MTTTHVDTCADFAHRLNTAGFGPVDSITLNNGITHVTLAATNHTAHTMRKWLEQITVRDMTAGKFSKSDPMLRLHLRGQINNSDTGTFVIVTGPFRDHDGSTITRAILQDIEKQNPKLLLSRLATLESLDSSKER